MKWHDLCAAGNKTMKGIFLEDKKDASLVELTIRRPSPPYKVFLPLQQGHVDRPAHPCVAVGMSVALGQKIANPSHEQSVALHASLSGKVEAIRSFQHPVLGRCKAIEIHSDGTHKKIPALGQERPAWASLGAGQLLDLFQENGLLDLSLSMKPVHAALRRTEGDHPIQTVILNGCESEPYVTSDHVLVMSHTMEILRGADLLRKACGAEQVRIVLRKDQLEAIELLKSKIFLCRLKGVEVCTVTPVYPQDTEALLIQAAGGPGPMAGYRPDQTGFEVLNIATAFAAYEAVVLQKPLYERVVTMGGECIVDSKNLWIRNGALFEDCLQACRGLLRQPRKVIMGGPMRGEAQSTLEIPVLKGTQAILVLPKEVARPQQVEP
ncbi:SLBB domain-containing protein, partial [Omnitrophica bacterium]|nr:SLBB domain-containing protein [Candidatus Omnitrophota bacterium]